MTKVQRASLADVPKLLPLVAAYWQFESVSGFDAERVATQLRRLLSAPQLGIGWIATAEGTAVGYLLAVYVFSLEHLGVTAEIDEFFVSPPHRRCGVGEALLATAEGEFLRHGCTNVSLQLSRSNEAARGFYHRHGYGERSAYELLDKTLRDA